MPSLYTVLCIPTALGHHASHCLRVVGKTGCSRTRGRTRGRTGICVKEPDTPSCTTIHDYSFIDYCTIQDSAWRQVQFFHHSLPCSPFHARSLGEAELFKPNPYSFVISLHPLLTPPYAIEATHEPKPIAKKPQRALIPLKQQSTEFC